MADMTREEIEKLAEKLANIAVAVDSPDSMIGRAARALRQLLQEREWEPISELPEELKDGSTFLVGGGLLRGPIWADAAFWHDGSECHPGRGEAGLFFESDRCNLLTARNVSAEVFLPLPLPPSPSTKGEDDA
jgi:hypothetical protein